MSFVPRLSRYLKLSVRSWVVSLAPLAVFAPLAHSQGPERPSQGPAVPRPEAVHDHAAAIFGQLPMRFEKNQGQADAHVKFVSRNGAYSVLLAPNEAVLALDHGKTHKKGSKPSSRATLHLRLVNAKSNPAIIGIEELPAKSNYFIGNDPKRWLTKIANYSRVRYEQVYPGVNLDYYGNQRGLEYDFVIAPGADASHIQFQVAGDQLASARVRLASNGDLLIKVDGEEIRLKKPVVYQLSDSQSRTEVKGSFVLEAKNQVGFELGTYDHSRQLIIDPAIVYSTYLGGSTYSNANAVAVFTDPVTGHTYAFVAGATCDSDFPTKNALQSSLAGGGCGASAGEDTSDAFVAKIDPSASGAASLVWSTYLGGSDFEDFASSIAVDATGNVCLGGNTNSLNFPTVNAFQSTRKTPAARPFSNAFVAKISADGGTLLYSTYFGGSVVENAHAIALDPSGRIYLAGSTGSSDLPTINPLLTAGSGFLAIFDATLSGQASMIYSSYFSDSLNAVIADAASRVHVGGLAAATFPVVNGFQTVGGGSFYAKLNPFAPPASQLIYSTFLGPAGPSGGVNGVAVDSAGNAYVLGEGLPGQVPTTLGAYNSQGDTPAFVAKINPSASGAGSLIYSASLGLPSAHNGNPSKATGIAIDASGDAYVVGFAGPGIQLVNPVQAASVGLFQSVNAGTTWTSLNHGLLGDYRFQALAIDISTSPRRLYAGTTNGAVYSSNDGGLNWNKGLQVPNTTELSPCTNSSAGCVFALAVDPTSPSNVFAGTTNGVYKTADGGVTWTLFNQGLSGVAQQGVFALTFDNNALYGAAADGVYKITSNGNSWSTTSLSYPTGYVVVDQSTTPHTIYAGTGTYLPYGPMGVVQANFKSTDGGINWSSFSPLDSCIEDLSVDTTTHPSTLYQYDSLYCDQRLETSSDGGNTWSVKIDDYATAGPFFRRFAFDQTQNPHIFYLDDSSDGLRRYFDGSTYRVIGPTYLGVLQTDPSTGNASSPEVLYAGSDQLPNNVFVAELNPSGSALLFSTYLGSWAGEVTHLNGISVDSNNNIYIAGNANLQNFPVLNGLPSSPQAFASAFFTEIGTPSLPQSASGPVATQLGVPNGTLTVSLPNITGSATTSPPTLAVTALSATDTANFSLSNNLGAYDISTTATFSASTANPVTICFQAQTVNDPTTFAGLRLIHIVNGNPVDSTSSHDFISRTVCGSVTSLSPFVLIDGVPKVGWPVPAGIIYGSQLGSAQLNATASVPGTFAYTPAAGTVLAPGQQTLSVTFTPANPALYSSVTKTVPIQVSYSTGSCNGDVGHSVLQPINSDGTSVFKLGSTVPTKFRVCDANGNSVGLAGTVVSYTLTGAGSTSGLAIDEDVYSTSADSAFRWDSTGKQWIFNQATGKSNASLAQTNTIYQFQITLKDGSIIQFRYGLK